MVLTVPASDVIVQTNVHLALIHTGRVASSVDESVQLHGIEV
jgi:hypothetical protein